METEKILSDAISRIGFLISITYLSNSSIFIRSHFRFSAQNPQRIAKKMYSNSKALPYIICLNLFWDLRRLLNLDYIG